MHRILIEGFRITVMNSVLVLMMLVIGFSKGFGQGEGGNHTRKNVVKNDKKYKDIDPHFGPNSWLSGQNPIRIF